MKTMKIKHEREDGWKMLRTNISLTYRTQHFQKPHLTTHNTFTTHTLPHTHKSVCFVVVVVVFLKEKLLGGGGARKIEIAICEGGHTCVSVYACKCLHYDSAK